MRNRRSVLCVSAILLGGVFSCGAMAESAPGSEASNTSDGETSPSISCFGSTPDDPVTALQDALPACQNDLLVASADVGVNPNEVVSGLMQCMLRAIGCSHDGSEVRAPSVSDSSEIGVATEALIPGGTRTCADQQSDQLVLATCTATVAAKLAVDAAGCAGKAALVAEFGPLAVAQAFAVCMAKPTITAAAAIISCRLKTCAGQGATCCGGKCLDPQDFENNDDHCGECKPCGADQHCSGRSCLCDDPSVTKCGAVCCSDPPAPTCVIVASKPHSLTYSARAACSGSEDKATACNWTPTYTDCTKPSHCSSYVELNEYAPGCSDGACVLLPQTRQCPMGTFCRDSSDGASCTEWCENAGDFLSDNFARSTCVSSNRSNPLGTVVYDLQLQGSLECRGCADSGCPGDPGCVRAAEDLAHWISNGRLENGSSWTNTDIAWCDASVDQPPNNGDCPPSSCNLWTEDHQYSDSSFLDVFPPTAFCVTHLVRTITGSHEE
jgi:hypothetical protein